MEFVTLTPEHFSAWDDFCTHHHDAWFWHTSLWLRYSLIYRPKLQSKNLSFFVYDQGRITAIVPLFLETYDDGHKEFSFGDDFGPAPVSVGNIDVIFEHIDQLASVHGVQRVRLRGNPLALVAENNCGANPFIPHGYFDTTIATRILDLRQPLPAIRSHMRHGHDSDITRAAKVLSSRVMDVSTFDERAFQSYVDLHRSNATIPRMLETYQIMAEALRAGNGMLVFALQGERLLGCSYFYLYKKCAYYGSACKVSDVRFPIAHLIQWKAIEWMHAHGITHYEIGWQHYPITLSEIPTEKEITISQFKRGFGGINTSLFRGEKYYDRTFMNFIIDARFNALQRSLFRT